MDASVPVRFTHHAVDRYIERLRPALTPRTARDELRHLARLAGALTDQAPAWYQAAAPCDAFLLIGDDVVLPLMLDRGRHVAVTVVTRGSLPASIRQARNRSNAARRFHRRTKPRPSGRPRPVADALPAAHGGAW